MKHSLGLCGFVLCSAVVVAGNLFAQSAEEKKIAQGKYLATGVAQCVRCHTPRGSDGQPDLSRVLQGGSPPAAGGPSGRPAAGGGAPGGGRGATGGGGPAAEGGAPPVIAPPLAGLPDGYTEESLIQLLQTGLAKDGKALRNATMRSFRMTREDAEAVVAYLKSVKASGR